MVSVAVYLEVEANKFKNFRLKFIQLVNAWDILKVPTFLWSLLWILNGLPYNSLPHSQVKKWVMRLKTKWLKTELSTSFWSFKMRCKNSVTVWKQVFLITINIQDQLCFTSLKSCLIDFSRLISRHWPWLLWHNLLYSMSYLELNKNIVWQLLKDQILSTVTNICPFFKFWLVLHVKQYKNYYWRTYVIRKCNYRHSASRWSW